MKTYAAILAAGSGSRFGADKTAVLLGGKPVWRWSFDTYQSHPQIAGVIVVASANNLEGLRKQGCDNVVPGGLSRKESSRAALEATPSDADALLIHDAARPFVTGDLIDRVIGAVEKHGAAAASLEVVDAIKLVEDGHVRDLPRRQLFAMQTPQGGRIETLRRAHEAANGNSAGDFVDDLALMEAIGIHPALVKGDSKNFKITTPEDMVRAQAQIGSPEFRTGLGYDVHPFSNDPERTLMLGGVAFSEHAALDGHSDADVLLHAITDAILGAACLGDIGQHFPNTDEQWKGKPSTIFLEHSAHLVAEAGWTIVHLDSTLIAESPKIMRRASEIRQRIATSVGITPDRVSVKATTNERLGSIGRGEGIAAFATATLRRLG